MWYSFDSWHSLCGISLPLMPGILLKLWSTYGLYKSPIEIRGIVWMTNNNTSLGPLSPLVCWGGDIGMCKHTRCAGRECLAVAKAPRTYCNGGSCISAVWWIWIMDVVCKATWKQLSVGHYNSILMGHAIKLILNKRFKQTIIGMDIRYSKYIVPKIQTIPCKMDLSRVQDNLL